MTNDSNAHSTRAAIGRIFSSGSHDIPAGFVVFLVALPLCLGIALASNAPLASGLMSGAIAGLVVSWLSGSQLSVSGPAAGLTLTIATAITTLGSFEAVLVAVFLAGCMQMIFGLMRTGMLASFFPHSVIKGMLAAIGLIIILKQVPHALGWDADFVGDESFDQAADHENTFSEIARAFERIDLGSLVVAILAISALVFWGSKRIQKSRIFSRVPAPLVAVIVGVCVNEILKHVAPDIALMPGSHHLVSIPTGGLTGFFSQLPSPKWTAIGDFTTWRLGLSIALIASIESLLSIEATDKLDPDRRVSNSNRELIAQGAGNMLCGMFGGLPMTSVIVRSSANIYAGARTRLSSFIHGLLLVVAVLALSRFLNLIPLAALAVVLITVGFKLVNFKLLKGVLDEGVEQSLPFFVTLAAIVSTDLLTGVGIGLIVGLLIVVRMNHHSAITQVSDGRDMLVRFAKDVTFAHKPTLKNMLAEIPDNMSVTVDGTGAQFIDHDILEVVKDFQEGAPHRNINVRLRNLRSKRMSFKGVRDGKLQEPFASK